MTFTTHQNGTLQRLLDLQQNTILTDFNIIFNNQTLPCHKAVAVLASNAIASCVVFNEFCLFVPESVRTTPQVIESVIDSFYGVPFTVNHKNALAVYECSRFLDMSLLFDVSETVINNFQPKTYNTSLDSVLSHLQNDQFRDFSLVYKSVTIKFHKFLLAAVCPIFLSRFELQPGDNEWNLTDFLTIQESSFNQFFSSFYSDCITITIENLFDISHLAFYFQMSSLESCCDSLMNSAEPLVSWIFPALESANKADDLRFVDSVASVLVKVDDLAQFEPVAIKPDVFYKLCPKVNVFWLTNVLVHSYFHYDINSSQRYWTPHELEKSLTQLDTKSLPIDQLYSIIKPLLNVEELYFVLSEFSLTRFTTEQSEIPSEWLVWLMVELNKNEPTDELNLTTRFASLLSNVFTSATLSQIEPLVLHPRSLTVYISNITQQYLILWFVRSLIISWNVENHWTIEIFDEILSIVNLENVSFSELIAALKPLECNAKLFDSYCKFVTFKFTPLVIREYTKTRHELEVTTTSLVQKTHQLCTSIHENESLRISRGDVEKKEQLARQKLEELEAKLEELTVENNELQSENFHFKLIVDKHAEIIRCAEEDDKKKLFEEAERHRIEKEHKIFEEQRLQSVYRSNPLSFIANNTSCFFDVCGGKVKFLRETSGSNILISHDDNCAAKSSSCWPNSFVAINRPPVGHVVLTVNNVANSFLGVFDPSQAQSSPTNLVSGIYVRSTEFYVWIRGFDSNRINTTINRVIVQFTQSNFKITVPQANWSRDYDYEEGWVFGVMIYSSGVSWSLEGN
ncbi:hypothetical protein RCL1_003023 [Eukaryota sp. TZLM3-RCL]